MRQFLLSRHLVHRHSPPLSTERNKSTYEAELVRAKVVDAWLVVCIKVIGLAFAWDRLLETILK